MNQDKGNMRWWESLSAMAFSFLSYENDERPRLLKEFSKHKHGGDIKQ